MRTLLAARSLPVEGVAPMLAPELVTPTHPTGRVSRALLAARRETTDAFRTAGRVVRSLF